jgi:hypothetical protein
VKFTFFEAQQFLTLIKKNIKPNWGSTAEALEAFGVYPERRTGKRERRQGGI